MKYVIQMMFPDGPHWYTGQVKHPIDANAEFAHWSPYWADRKSYDNELDAEIAHAGYCSKSEGAIVVSERDALWNDSRILGEGCLFWAMWQYLQPGWGITLDEFNTVFTVVEKVDALITFSIDGEEYNIERDKKEFVKVVKLPHDN